MAAAPGCGEKNGGDRLSKEEYVKQADAVCTAFDKRLDALPEPRTIEDVVTLTDKAEPIAKAGLAALRKLRPPSDLAEDVDAWLALNEANVEAIGDLRAAAKDSDETEARAISADAAENEAKADALAKRIGLVACAKDG